MMCGIDEAIRHIREDCSEFMWAEHVINRMEYHRNQAVGVRPRYHKRQSIKDYYTCGSCGNRVEIIHDFCWKCGYQIKWDSIRCLTGLPLVDAAERSKKNDGDPDQHSAEMVREDHEAGKALGDAEDQTE